MVDYILILIMTCNTNMTVNTIEFPSKFSCESFKAEIVNNKKFGGNIKAAECVRKNW